MRGTVGPALDAVICVAGTAKFAPLDALADDQSCQGVGKCREGRSATLRR
jgi:hypothetical protein